MPGPRLSMSAIFHRSALLSGFSCSLLLLGGCGSIGIPLAATDYSTVAGIWQFNASASAASKLPQLGGYLEVSGNKVTGSFGPMVPAGGSAQNLCVPLTDGIQVAGSISANRQMTLTSTGFDGGTVTLTGTLASDNRSLTNATYGVTNGSCAFATAVPLFAVGYTQPQGTYSGTFQGDPDSNPGASYSVVATIDAGHYHGDPSNGDYRTSGSLTMIGEADCVPNQVKESANLAIQGGSFTATTAANDVTVSGTDSTDGTQINITNYTFNSGPCTGLSGSIILTQQPTP